jgi:predicted nicotinamide N-methyase
VKRPEFFRGRNVLELGSGAGLSGVTLSRICCLEDQNEGKVVLTDKNVDVINLLKRNVRNNLAPGK